VNNLNRMNAHHIIIRKQIRWTLQTFCRALRNVNSVNPFPFFVQVEYGWIISWRATGSIYTFSCGLIIPNIISSLTNMVQFFINTGNRWPVFLIITHWFCYILKDMKTLGSTNGKGSIARLRERTKSINNCKHGSGPFLVQNTIDTELLLYTRDYHLSEWCSRLSLRASHSNIHLCHIYKLVN